MANSEDLWPDDLVSSIPRTPAHILWEQAAALGRKTNNVVQAKVRNGTDRGGDFRIAFVLFSPSLQGYEYNLFSFWHSEELYPVHHEMQILNDEESFTAYLRQLFSSQRTTKIIRALIAQARAQSGDNEEDDDIPF